MTRVTRGFGFFEGFLANQRSALANRLIPSDLREGKLLDIGCGNFPSFLLNSKFSKKVGIDKSFEPGKIKHSDDLQLLKWDIEKSENLPFDSESFDIVTMLAVLEHIETDEITDIISDIFRILKKDGYFILTTPAAWSEKLFKPLAKLKLVSSDEINEHKSILTIRKITGVLKSGGFSTENIGCGHFEFYFNTWAKAKK